MTVKFFSFTVIKIVLSFVVALVNLNILCNNNETGKYDNRLLVTAYLLQRFKIIKTSAKSRYKVKKKKTKRTKY